MAYVNFTKGCECLEEDGLVDVVGEVADEEGLLGLGSFLHLCAPALGVLAGRVVLVPTVSRVVTVGDNCLTR